MAGARQRTKENTVPEFAPLAIYLDANVLFSAAYISNCELLKLWRLRRVTPVTSLYAVGEVRRHAVLTTHQVRLEELIAKTLIVSDADVRVIPPDVILPAKDQPILAAAIAASVDYLLTGDKAHFHHLYSRTISGVGVLRPAEFLSLHMDRLAE